VLLIHESLYDVLPGPFAETVQTFQRDLGPQREAEIWELLAAIYLHIVREDNVPPEGRGEVLDLALKASMRPLNDEDGADLEYITVARFQEVRKELEELVNMFA
jgi:hypothetical protein